MTTPLQLLAEPRREAILRMVWTQEKSAGDIAAAFDVSFGAVSQHLKKLRDAGLVEVRREGKQRFYRAVPEAFGALAPYLERQWGLQLDRLKVLAEEAEAAHD